MTSTSLDFLEHAIRTKEILKIRYNGGSQPGTVREIVAIAIPHKKVLVAHCVGSDSLKSFRLEKTEIVNEEEKVTYDPNLTTHTLLLELAKPTLKELETIGLHVELTENFMAVYTLFKNGKPKKRPLASISKNNEGEGVTWRVDSSFSSRARVYKSLSKAFTWFKEQLDFLKKDFKEAS